MSYKVIVVGLDRSERGSIAVDKALGLARATGATLHAVHVVHPAVEAGTVSSKAWQQVIDQERGEVEACKAQLLGDAALHGVPVEFHMSGMSDIPEAIISTAESVGADLVVVGNRGMSGRARFVLGSVPNKVAHRCQCSVLIVNTEIT
jgi:nucleotide-binding universal stress UspA family protein